MTDLENQERDLIEALHLIDAVRKAHVRHQFCEMRDPLVVATEAIDKALYEVRYEIEEESPIRHYRPAVSK